MDSYWTGFVFFAAVIAFLALSAYVFLTPKKNSHPKVLWLIFFLLLKSIMFYGILYLLFKIWHLDGQKVFIGALLAKGFFVLVVFFVFKSKSKSKSKSKKKTQQ